MSDRLKQTLVMKRVKKHAQANYENGWDYMVECYSEEELLEEIAGRTFDEFVKFTEGVIDARNEHKPMAGWDY